MKEFILFDNDGVLVETEIWYYEASKKTLKEEFDINFDFEDYMNIMINGGAVWGRALQNGFSQNQIDKARDKRNKYYQEFLQTKDLKIRGVKETIDKLSKKYKMAIVTTSRRVDFEIIHKNTNLTQYMDFVLCEEDYTLAKPHPEPYLKALKYFNTTNHKAIVVEDSQRGLTAAYKANIDCITVFNEFTKTQDFSLATKRINKFEELLKLL